MSILFQFRSICFYLYYTAGKSIPSQLFRQSAGYVTMIEKRFTVFGRGHFSVIDSRRQPLKGYYLAALLSMSPREVMATFCFRTRRVLVTRSRKVIAVVTIDLLLVFYNSKILNCIGALSFFKDLFTHFYYFLKSNWSGDFGPAET